MDALQVLANGRGSGDEPTVSELLRSTRQLKDASPGAPGAPGAYICGKWEIQFFVQFVQRLGNLLNEEGGPKPKQRGGVTATSALSFLAGCLEIPKDLRDFLVENLPRLPSTQS